jgi:hypothetical protein
MKEQIFALVIKIALLYLAIPLLLLDLILIQTAVPRLIFEVQPYIYSALFVLIAAYVISRVAKSKAPVLWAVFFLLYSAAFFTSQLHVILFGISFSAVALLIAITYLSATINFLYRNKVTEPLLALLPVCAGAWLYLSLVYQPSLVAWAAYTTGRSEVVSTLLEVFGDPTGTLVMVAIVVIPSAILYFLGKHGYVRPLNYALSQIRNLKQSKSE